MRVALGQIRVDRDPEVNLAAAAAYAKEAADLGPRLLVLPEGIIGRDPDDSAYTSACAQPIDGPFVTRLRTITREHRLALAATVHVPSPDGRAMNVFVLVDDGDIVCTYQKLHPYDAFSARESDVVAPGHDLPPLFELEGLTCAPIICYDLRFPDLSLRLALAGADVIVCPAAWVVGPLKEHHWTSLVTARALDTTSYVVACGEVSQRNIGRSLIVDPLGLTIAAAAEQPCLVVADLDPARVAHARKILPVLANRRLDPPRLSNT